MKKNNLIWITPFSTLKKNIKKSKQWDFVKSKSYGKRTELFFEIGEIKKKDKIIGIIQYDVSIPQHTLLLKIEGVKTKNFSISCPESSGNTFSAPYAGFEIVYFFSFAKYIIYSKASALTG